MRDTAEVIKRLAKAGFMINLKKSHLCETSLTILGHQWRSGGYWMPEPAKLKELVGASTDKLRKLNRAALFGLLNFYREYVPQFAEVTEPIRRLLGDDCKAWTEVATTAVKEVAALILNGVKWLAFDREQPLLVESRVTPIGLSVVMMQRDPEAPRTWAPVAGWGRALTETEANDPLPLLELRAL
jgi:hypothetical protein